MWDRDGVQQVTDDPCHTMQMGGCLGMSRDLLDPDPGHTGYWEMHMERGGAFPLGISATGVLVSSIELEE